MNASVVLTIVCDDRPGIVEALSQVLQDHGGNWTESSMLSLAGKFAGILLASLPPQQVESFLLALQGLQSAGMHIVAQRSSEQRSPGAMREFTLDLVGQDRPGIVHDISEILARHHVNVQQLGTECQSASMSGEMLFLAKAHLLVPAQTSIGQLRRDLENLANELMVDITLHE
ncbi:MAG: glycine cleavage system protein R [Xanthomonadales bacterium]|nr:glycine cleavage system protein R [Xanthomonadales bacterium]